MKYLSILITPQEALVNATSTADTHLSMGLKQKWDESRTQVILFAVVAVFVLIAVIWVLVRLIDGNPSTTYSVNAPAPISVGAGNSADTNLTLVLQGDRKALAETMGSVNQLSATVGSIKNAVEGLQKDVKSLQADQAQFRRQIDVNVLIKQLDERAKIPTLQKVPPPLSRLEGDGLNFLPSLA